MIKKAYWKLRIFWLCLKAVKNTNLGDKVMYKGKEYIIVNGVHCGAWDIQDKFTVGAVRLVVPRSECKKVWSIAGMRQSFFMAWHFYMTSWFDIWCRNGILPWMRGCRIWQEPNK